MASIMSSATQRVSFEDQRSSPKSHLSKRSAPSAEVCGWVALNRHVACHTHTTSVRHVALVGVVMGHSEWAWLCHVLPSLAALNILRLEDIGLDDTQFSLLANTVLQQQQQLCIASRRRCLQTRPNANEEETVAGACASPRILSVRGNALTARSMLPLGKLVLWWSASLHTVDASHNPIGDYGAQVLGTILAKQNLGVMCSHEGSTLFPQCGTASRRVPKHSRTSKGTASASFFDGSEKGPCGLSRLVLQHIRCTIRGLEDLLVGVSCMDWIQEVDLSENAGVGARRGRGPRSAATTTTSGSFAELQRNCSLRHVALQSAGLGHQLSPAGVEALLLSLWMSCPVLESLSLDNSHPPVLSAAEVEGHEEEISKRLHVTRVGDALAVLVDQLVVAQEAQEAAAAAPLFDVSAHRRMAYPQSLHALRALSLQACGLTDEGVRVLVSAMARSSRVAATRRSAPSSSSSTTNRSFVLCNLRCLNVDRNYLTSVGVLDLLDAMVHLHWERCARETQPSEAAMEHSSGGDELDDYLFVLSAAMSVGVETMHDLDAVFDGACDLLQAGGLLSFEEHHQPPATQQRASPRLCAKSNFHFSFGPYGAHSHTRDHTDASGGKHPGSSSSLQERLEMGFTLQEYCEDIRGLEWTFRQPDLNRGRTGHDSTTKRAEAAAGRRASVLPPLSSAGSPAAATTASPVAAATIVAAGDENSRSPGRVGDISSVAFSPPRSSSFVAHGQPLSSLSPPLQAVLQPPDEGQALSQPDGSSSPRSVARATYSRILEDAEQHEFQREGSNACQSSVRGEAWQPAAADDVEPQQLSVHATPTSEFSDAPEPSPFVPHLHLHRGAPPQQSSVSSAWAAAADASGASPTTTTASAHEEVHQSVMVITAADKATARKAKLDANRKRRKLLLDGAADIESDHSRGAVEQPHTTAQPDDVVPEEQRSSTRTRSNATGGNGSRALGGLKSQRGSSTASWRHTVSSSIVQPAEEDLRHAPQPHNDATLSHTHTVLEVEEVVEEGCSDHTLTQPQEHQQAVDTSEWPRHAAASPPASTPLLPDVVETLPPTRQTSSAEVVAADASATAAAPDAPLDLPPFELRMRIPRDPSRLLGRFKTFTLTYSHPPGHVICRLWHLLSDLAHSLHTESIDALQEDLLDILLPPDEDSAHSVESVQIAANDVAMTLDITFSTNEKRQTMVQRLQSGAARGGAAVTSSDRRFLSSSFSEEQCHSFPRSCRLLLLHRRDSEAIDIGARLDDHLRRAGPRAQLNESFTNAWDVLHEFHGRTSELFAEVPELLEVHDATTTTTSVAPATTAEETRSAVEVVVSGGGGTDATSDNRPVDDNQASPPPADFQQQHRVITELHSASSPRSGQQHDTRRLPRIANDLPWALPSAAEATTTAASGGGSGTHPLPTADMMPQRWVRSGPGSTTLSDSAGGDATWVLSFLETLVDGGGGCNAGKSRDDSVARVLTVVFRDSENEAEDLRGDAHPNKRPAIALAKAPTEELKVVVHADRPGEADEPPPPPPPPPDMADSVLSPKRLTAAPPGGGGDAFGDLVVEEGDDDDADDDKELDGSKSPTRASEESFSEMASRRIASHKSLSFLRTPPAAHRHPSPSSGATGQPASSSARRGTVTFAPSVESGASSSSSSPSAVRRSASHAALVHLLTHHPDGPAATQSGLTVETVQRRIRNLERLCRDSVAKGDIALSQGARNKVRICQGLMHPVDPEVIHLGCLAFSPSAALPARDGDGATNDSVESGVVHARRTKSTVSMLRVTLSVEWDGLLVLKEDRGFGDKSLLLVHPLGYGVHAHIEGSGSGSASSSSSCSVVLRLQTLSNPAEEAEEAKLVSNAALRGKIASSAVLSSSAVPSPSKSLFQTAMQQCDITIRVDSHKKATRALATLAECSEKAKRMLLQKPAKATTAPTDGDA